MKRSASRDEILRRVVLIVCALAFLGGAVLLVGGNSVPDLTGGDDQDRAPDAGGLFAGLPDGLSYEPLPDEVRRRLEDRIEDAVADGSAEVKARQIVRSEDGATGVIAAITTGFDEDIGKTVRENDDFDEQTIDGTVFLVGPTSGGRVALKIDNDHRAVAVYAATRAQLRAFAAPFAGR